MEYCKQLLSSRITRGVGAACALLLFVLLGSAPQSLRAENERVITIYHDGIEQTVVSNAKTVAEVLKRADIRLTDHDAVEPARKTELVAPSYNVNIYRARPVTVVDGNKRSEIMSPHSSARKIAESAGVKLFNEDKTHLTRIDDFLSDGGVGIKMTITRATPVIFDFYGTKSTVRTQAKTVGELLQEKQVNTADIDGMNVDLSDEITEGMSIKIWRNGVQTITEKQDIPFTTKQIRDTDRDAGYREITTPGKPGKKVVTYKIELINGKEVSRKELQVVITAQPKEQVEVVGVKLGFSGVFQDALANLRGCEAGGVYDRNSGNGYYGAYQFSPGTWVGAAPEKYKSVLPHQAPAAAQDQAAYNLYQRRGWQPWPGCTAKLGLQDVYR